MIDWAKIEREMNAAAAQWALAYCLTSRRDARAFLAHGTPTLSRRAHRIVARYRRRFEPVRVREMEGV